MNVRFLLSLACLAVGILSASLGTAATRGGGAQIAASAPMRTAPAVTHTPPATTTTPFQHHRSRVVIFDTFGYPFFPYWYPYWYGYYPYGYYYYNGPVYGKTYGDGSIVAEVQRPLARAGYYHGAIDGVVGPQTRGAIRAYERAHGLRVDGVISRQLIATMGPRE